MIWSPDKVTNHEGWIAPKNCRHARGEIFLSLKEDRHVMLIVIQREKKGLDILLSTFRYGAKLKAMANTYKA